MKSIKEMNQRELQLRKVVKDIVNEYVGDNQNHYYDYNEVWTQNPGIKECEEYVYDRIMKDTHRYCDDGTMIDLRQLRYLGKEFIQEMIHIRTLKDYANWGWDFPHEEVKQKLLKKEEFEKENKDLLKLKEDCYYDEETKTIWRII